MQKFDLRPFISRHAATSPDLVERFLPCLPSHSWVAGGAVRRAIGGESILASDVDVFFRSVDDMEKARSHFLAMGRSTLHGESDFNISMSCDIEGVGAVKIQLIKMYAPSPPDTIENFDFTICQFATDGESLWCGDYSLWDLARKRLAINKVSYGTSTMRRMSKYMRQGFVGCGGMMADFLQRIAENPDLIQADVEYID